MDPSGHLVPALAGAIIGGIGGFIVGTATEAGRLIDQGGDYDWQADVLNIGNSAMAGFVGGGVLGGTGNPALAGMAGGASYGLLDGVAHTDPQGSFTDNSLMVLQSTAIGGMAGGMGGLAGGGVAGALAGTSLSMTTQAFLAGSAAGIYGGSTARILSGTGITPATVTQDALMGGANGLIFYGVASAYQQVTAPKPSTTSLQERANLVVELSEAEGCASDTVLKDNKLALGLSDYLDDFAANNNAHTWKDFADPTNWKEGVNNALFNPDMRIIVNLDGVDNPLLAAQRAAGNIGGATDWELFQIKTTPSAWYRITWYENGKIVPNPFEYKE